MDIWKVSVVACANDAHDHHGAAFKEDFGDEKCSDTNISVTCPGIVQE